MGDLTSVKDLKARVEDEIKGRFASLIPEDIWCQMVDKTVEDFNRNELEPLIKELYKSLMVEALKTEFAKPEWQSTFNNRAQEVAPELVKKILLENTQEMFMAMFQGMGNVTAEAMRNKMWNIGINI